MTVTLIVQDDTGLVADANTYCSLVDFKSYHDSRGHSYVGKTDDQISVALIRATDYIDNRFRFTGQKLTGQTQSTMWPRAYVADPQVNVSNTTNYAYWVENTGFPFIPSATINGIDRALVRATAEYALRALTLAQLVIDQIADTGGGVIASLQEILGGGAIETNTVYQDIPIGTIVYSVFPEADNLLRARGLIPDSANRVGR